MRLGKRVRNTANTPVDTTQTCEHFHLMLIHVEPGDPALSPHRVLHLPTPRARQRWGLVVITVAAFFMAADVTITNVALPAIATELNASMSALQWVVDSYNIVLAGLLLLGAGVGERFSRKWAFLVGVSMFTVGSLAAGLSQTVGQLVASRTLMGVGAALLLAPALSLIAVLFAPQERAKAVAAWATGGALGLGSAPVIGGLILTRIDWHWVFLINVPFMIATVIAGALILPNSRADQQHRLDVVGALLSVVGFASFLGALIEAPARGWASAGVLIAGAVGAAFIAMFVRWELRHEHPMFEVRVLRHPLVLGASLCLMGSYVSFTGLMFLLAQQLQVGAHMSAISVGVLLAPFALVFWVMSRSAHTVARRLEPTRVLLVGMALMIASFAGLAMVSGSDSIAAVLIFGSMAALGWGLIIPIGSVVILNALPPDLTGSASGTSMLSRFVGASVGIAVLGTVIAMSLDGGNAHADPVRFADGVTKAFWAGACMLAILSIAAGLATHRSSREDGHPATA